MRTSTKHALVLCLSVGAAAPFACNAQVASALLRELDAIAPGGPTVSSLNNTGVNAMGGYAITVNTSDSLSNVWGNLAGGPVTDWRNYDTIYTERYMGTPQENVDGYRRSSVVAAAKQLHGRLLLLHGGMDDNVHVQNTLQLVEALQAADKDFELMIYPRSRHGLGGQHYQRLVVDFIKRNLRPQ